MDIKKEANNMQAAKGKRQVTLTLTVEAYQQLQTLAEKAGRTLAGYIRWVLKEYLQEMEERGT